jgi:hypothetical protein
MTPKLFFYLYIVFGVVLVGAAIYNYIYNPTAAIKSGIDLIIAVYVFFRAYRINKTRQDSELM